jgi:hypothetical protein
VTEPAVETPQQEEEQPWSPFPDQETAQFHTDKDVRQVQLHAELEQALDRTVQLSTSSTPGEVGEHLWIVPADVDTEVVEQVIADHVPDPNWGVPQSTRDWFDIQRRITEDPEIELTADEIQTVVKGLLARQMG